tara:strand:+ start:1505 stop:2131 length:627 start_codon:yes stop_codon:yes gene_type:complete
MTDQIATQNGSQPSALALMADRCNVEPTKLLKTLKETVFKGASDEELLALVVVSNRYGLDPLTKQIYAFPNRSGGIVPVVSADGWFSMMNQHPRFAGVEAEMAFDKDGKPESCTATLWLTGTDKPVKVTEYYGECFRKTEPWQQMPSRMLRHKAICQAARIAFGFSGVYDEDEGRDIAQSVQKRTTGKPVIKRLKPKAKEAKEDAVDV